MSKTINHATLEQILRNPQNNSTTKYQFSFPKAQRFRREGTKTANNQYHYYDLPSTKSNRAASFGISAKTSFAIKSNNPPPTRYIIKGDFEDQKSLLKAPSFGVGRQAYKKVNSFIRLSDIPGPGTYQPNPEFIQPKISANFSLGKKVESLRIKTDGPGPGAYDVKSPLLYEERVLSQDKRFACPKIVPLKEYRRIKTEQVAEHSDTIYMPRVTSKGDQMFGKNRGYSLGRSSRFQVHKDKGYQIPGPGYYKKFSEFIDTNI